MYTSNQKEPTIRDVWAARKRIAPLIFRTPTIYSFFLSEKIGRPVYLKLETVHNIGAFKIRGAANKIISLSEAQRRKGVTTFSTGNHGMAVAYIAQKLGLDAVICVSKHVPEVKIDTLSRLGAKLEIYGESQDEAKERCKQLASEFGYTMIPPFDDPAVIAGQGTIGLEIFEDIPETTDVVIPLSGGGLFSGIGLALKSLDPAIRLTGVSMHQSAVMYESLQAGYPVTLPEHPTLADSLLGGIGEDNQLTFPMVKKWISAFQLISEEEIANSMKFMMSTHRMIIEGAAATAIAAILTKKIPDQGGAIVAIMSGNNVDLSVIKQILEKSHS